MLSAYMPNESADVMVEYVVIAKFFRVDHYIVTYDVYVHCTVLLGEGTEGRGGSAASADGPQPNTTKELA